MSYLLYKQEKNFYLVWYNVMYWLLLLTRNSGDWKNWILCWFVHNGGPRILIGGVRWPPKLSTLQTVNKRIIKSKFCVYQISLDLVNSVLYMGLLVCYYRCIKCSQNYWLIMKKAYTENNDSKNLEITETGVSAYLQWSTLNYWLRWNYQL